MAPDGESSRGPFRSADGTQGSGERLAGGSTIEGSGEGEDGGMVGPASRGETGGIGCGGGSWETEAGSERSWGLNFLQSPPKDERSAGSVAQCGGGAGDVVTGRGGYTAPPDFGGNENKRQKKEGSHASRRGVR